MRFFLILSFFCIFGTSSQANPITLNFEGIDPDGAPGTFGPVGSEVNDTYADLGIRFENGVLIWYDLPQNNAGAGGNGSMRIGSTLGVDPAGNVGNIDESFFGKQQAIIVTFDKPVNDVSVTAINVGTGGARIDAYSDLAGTDLVGFAEDFAESGNGGDNNPRFGLSGEGILRVELYSPFGTTTARRDGIAFDDLTVTFEAIPAPAVAWLTIPALLALARFRS